MWMDDKGYHTYNIGDDVLGGKKMRISIIFFSETGNTKKSGRMDCKGCKRRAGYRGTAV